MICLDAGCFRLVELRLAAFCPFLVANLMDKEQLSFTVDQRDTLQEL